MTPYTNAKWGASALGTPGGEVTWSFATLPGKFADFDTPITSAAHQAAIRTAFETWEEIADIEFLEVNDSKSVDIRLSFSDIDGPYNVLGKAYWSYSAGVLNAAEVIFDSNEIWSTETTKTRGQDFKVTAIHEIGHAIGLAHSNDVGSIMYGKNLANAAVSAVDSAAITALYGRSPAPAAISSKVSTEKSSAIRDFDPLSYIASHGDLIAALGADAEAGRVHYDTFGRSEGRSLDFDGLEYIASHEDLAIVFGSDRDAGARHYIEFGFDEGRETDFDGLEYIASHSDLISAFGVDSATGAEHYIKFGRVENRKVDFDGLEYIAAHVDLLLAFGADAEAGAKHYIEFGFAEGRTRGRPEEPIFQDNQTSLCMCAACVNENVASKHDSQHGFDSAHGIDSVWS